VGTSIKGHFTDTNDQVIDPYITPRADVIAALGAMARQGASPEARANAARAIGILRGKAAIPDLVQAMHAKDTPVIYESLVALQKIRDPEAASSIAFLLRDLDPKVQIAAIETTGLLLNKSALPDLGGRPQPHARQQSAPRRADRHRHAARGKQPRDLRALYRG
jgi:HEAT repeat protein